MYAGYRFATSPVGHYRCPTLRSLVKRYELLAGTIAAINGGQASLSQNDRAKKMADKPKQTTENISNLVSISINHPLSERP
jgi:hypothetical protein